MKYDYDLLVIGAGSGGVRASRMAAVKGQKVAVIEAGPLGGTCVNLGCVPKKLFVYASHFGEDWQDSKGYGWEGSKPEFTWQTLLERKDNEILRLNGIYKNILGNAGVEIINGFASFENENTLKVGDKTYTAERILVCPGSRPFTPSFPGSEHVITSNEAFHLPELPKHVTIVGGGYIAVEFAGIFHGLHVETTQLYRGELFLRGFDIDLRKHVAEQMTEKGIDLRFNCDVDKVEKLDNGRYLVSLQNGTTLETDCVMYATGRVPNTDKLRLENTGVELGKAGAIPVDDNYQTSCPSIYAIGDVINRMQLTPVALAEGMYLVEHLYGSNPRAVDYDTIATAVFSQPNIGTVGPSEEVARAKYGSDDIEIYCSPFRPMKNTLSENPEKTLMKLIVQKSTDKVLAVHMSGPESGEIIQGFSVALKAGATKDTFDSTIGIHPTSAEEFVTMRSPVQ